MTEQAFQSKLIKRYENEGWYVIKLIQTNKGGIPDLLLLRPDEARFVEVKAAKGRASRVQQYRMAELRERGFKVELIKPDTP